MNRFCSQKKRGKRLTALVAVLMLLTSPAVLADEEDSSSVQTAGRETAAAAADLSERLPYMDEYLASVSSTPGRDTITLLGTEGKVQGQYTTQEGLNGADIPVLIADEGAGRVDWEFDIQSEGLYVIKATTLVMGSAGNNASRQFRLNGEQPYFEAGNLVFRRLWRDDGEIFENSIGDEVRPNVEEVVRWQTDYLYDSGGYYATPLILFLKEGPNSISLEYVTQDMAIHSLTIEPYEVLPAYEEVAASYEISDSAQGIVTFQAEDAMYERSDATIRLESDADPYNEPVAFGYRVFNTVGGSRWKTGGQTIHFQFYVEEDGYYQLGFRFLQTWSNGIPSHRRIAIDGEVPFEELKEYAFRYDSNWQTEALGVNGEPFLFYLEKGRHTLSMTTVMGRLTPVIHNLYDAMNLLSSMLQDITKLTGSDPDPNYDYQFYTYIPTLEGDFQALINYVQESEEQVRQISGENTSMGSSLSSVIDQMVKLKNDPFLIARSYQQLTQAQTNLGTWYLDIQSQPLLLDRFMLAGTREEIVHKRTPVLLKLRTSVYNFLLSFVKDYSSIVSITSDDVEIRQTIDVWIARGTEWAEILKELADREFTPQSGIQINLNVVPSSQLNTGSANALLLSITSQTHPDVAMGVASSSPVEFAIRDAVVDMQTFAGFSEVKERFIEDILIPYQYDGGIYALPETMNFTCLFYRKDILSSYGIELPQTREDLYTQTLPALYRNGMQYYQTADFSQFLYQHGGSYYTEDGLHSALDTPEAFSAFQEYTEMFTHYSSPVSASFFNRFRTGEMPLGIGNFSVYQQLSTAAPELVGKWGIALLPGLYREDGQIDRSFGSFAGECDIILKHETDERYQACFDFLEWWTSEETQRQYAREIESLLGVEARWNTANVDAFYSLEWSREDREVLMEQLQWARETPVVLGGYYTGRYLENAYTNVVVTGSMTPRDALEQAVKEINRELRMKQVEYGVTDDEQ